ncbi:transposase [Sphingobacterium faecium NBRC 15299]|uniref:site-specific integrase n=1 Tax=Sphingobacterium faecium TaxID=34087 RepID=UPI000D3C4D7F|nr:site-specific integrase [Sphingobacterium faecium]PTX09528.1 site-specific recombinase XerD [Sphingobacterium faecium]GEM63852.1 transposase [Sphingobacterium faecium NBRC 15299]
MLEKSFGLLFFLKKTDSSDGLKRKLYGRITVNGIAKEFSTKRTWFKDRWDQNANRAIGNKEDSKTINHYLDALVAKVYEVKRELITSGEDISTENLFQLLFGKTDDRKFILEIFKNENDKMKSLEGKDFATGTIQRYETSLSHTREFIKWKYNVEDLELRKLDYEFIKEYDFWLKTVRNCSQNTASKYLGNFKKIVLQCVKLGWIKKDPFSQFKLVKKDVIREFLTEDELKILLKKKFSIERLSLVRDIFIFSCFTGMAYIDVFRLTPSQFFTGVDEQTWISYTRKKTDNLTKIPLLPQALFLISKYDGFNEGRFNEKVFPCFSNQKMNAYLKEIADLCSIKKNLTFHMARHTFATTVTLTNGIPIETVSRMLGHKSLKQTQHYAKIIDKKISEDMTLLQQKYLQINIQY